MLTINMQPCHLHHSQELINPNSLHYMYEVDIKIIYHIDGTLDKHKASLVAKGYAQLKVQLWGDIFSNRKGNFNLA